MKRTNTATWYESKRRWQIKVQKNGIRKTFYRRFPGRAGQRECNAKADAWLDDGVENPNAKLSRLTAEYLENLKLTASTSHYTQYEKYLRLYIDPKIGNVRISDLHEQHLQSVIDYGYSKKLAEKDLAEYPGLYHGVYEILPEMQVHHAVPGRSHYPARSSQQAEINPAAGRPAKTFQH